MNNPFSITILIISGILLLCAIFSKKLHRMHKKDVENLKKRNESLSDLEKSSQKNTQNWAISILVLLG